MSKTETDDLIRRVAKRIVQRMNGREETDALALIPSYLTHPEETGVLLKERFSKGILCVGAGAAQLSGDFLTQNAETCTEDQRLTERMKGFREIALIGPPLWMLKNIARGDDRGFFEQLFLRALLGGKKVLIALEYERPEGKRGAFFKEIDNALCAMEDMGIALINVVHADGRRDQGVSLVTEAEVIKASRAGGGRVMCAPGAIITPLARDAAKELNVCIEEKAGRMDE